MVNGHANLYRLVNNFIFRGKKLAKKAQSSKIKLNIENIKLKSSVILSLNDFPPILNINYINNVYNISNY